MMTDRFAHFLEDQVDVALRIGPLPDSRLVATRLGVVRHIVCASHDYIAANGAPQTPEDLAEHRVISFQTLSAVSSWTFEVEGIEVATTLSSRLSVNTIDAALDAALSGAGLVRAVSYQVAEHVRAGRLALVLEDFEPKARPVYLVYDSQSRLPLKLRAFVDFVVPRLRQRLIDVTLGPS
jgi:DNA-binding transcriptional LysR family regulator